MATNREKYIDKASNKALAEKIIALARKDLFSLGWSDRKDNIMKWLSQEAEEQTQKEEIHLTMPEDENTRKAIEYIIPRLTLLSARLDKLEKSYIPTEEEQLKILDEINAEPKQEKTADEMFEELGYKKQGINDIIYTNDNKDNIIIRKSGYYIKYNYYNFHPDFDYNDINFITEAEDKAIHKKIEELKND